MLAELAYIDRLQRKSNPPKFQFTSKELVEMATVNPARLVRLDDRIGKLASGYVADLIVMRRPLATNESAYDALIHQRPTDLLLVIIGGTPVFGEPKLMTRLLPNQKLEPFMICGQQRMINARVASYQDVPWSATEAKLQSALAQYGISMAPLAEECTP